MRESAHSLTVQQNPLHDVGSNAPFPAREKSKELLIDLWILADRYSIHRLQNQAMELLIKLLAMTSLLTTADVNYMWSYRSAPSGPLKELVACTLVAELECAHTTKTIKDFDELALILPGFGAKMYLALRDWSAFAAQVKVKKNSSQWLEMLQSKDVRERLMVKVPKRVFPPPSAGRVRVERPLPMPMPTVPVDPGEVIEID